MSVRDSLVVPLFDEADALPALLDEVARHWRGGEVVFVDDGSRDGTGDRIAALARERGIAFVLLRHAENRGVGAAVRTGFRAARGERVVVYDADRPYPLEDAERLLEALGSADVATASPWHADGAAEGVGRLRAAMSRAASLLYRAALGRRSRGIRTFTCAFRAYRRSALERVSFRSDGFLSSAEILATALRLGLRVAEVPSRLRPRTEGRSKMRIARTAWAHARFLVGLALKRTMPPAEERASPRPRPEART